MNYVKKDKYFRKEIKRIRNFDCPIGRRRKAPKEKYLLYRYLLSKRFMKGIKWQKSRPNQEKKVSKRKK